MVTEMKWALFCLSVVSLPLSAAELSAVHSVYLLSMSNGMDQYLANRLTNQHVVQVVTDPQRADAIITDRIGEPLEGKLDELYPPPKPKEEAKPAEKVAKGSADKSKDADKDKEPGSGSTVPGFEPVNKLAPRPVSTFGRAKGTVFLVDVKSRQVLWSIYERPKDTSPHQLDRTANRIVERLKQDLAGKPAQP
jgi:hypothetical protein